MLPGNADIAILVSDKTRATDVVTAMGNQNQTQTLPGLNV